MTNQVTNRRAVILEALSTGPKTWTLLRSVYYPSLERQKSAASTSFYNQLGRMMEKGLIKKVMGGYEITEEGRRQMGEVIPDPAGMKPPFQLNGCQGCGREMTDGFTPLQDPQDPNLSGAVRWLCTPCVPLWERSGWSKKLA